MNQSAGIICWPTAPACLDFADDDLHVFAAILTVSDVRLAALSMTLSDAERERAGKFRVDIHRNRFIVRRGLLREILSRYLNTAAASFDFAYSKLGKPELGPTFAEKHLHFSLAHSENMALFAFTKLGAVGVDVECRRLIEDLESIVARFFSENENALFQMLPLEQRSAAFFSLWTRKEALLKATGDGITAGLNQVEVSFLPGEEPRFLTLPSAAGAAAEWSLSELLPATDFGGAVAIRAKRISVRCWKWHADS